MSSTGVGPGSGSAPVLLKMHGVSKAFDGVVALKGAALSVVQGEVHGLLGGNGAGKTSTMKALAGIIPPTSGKVYINGFDITNIFEKYRARK